jgi:hypothetical protein
VTPTEFKAFWPDGDFDALDGSYIQKFLDAAVTHFDVVRWGTRYLEGLACFVAHKIVISKARQAKGLQVDTGNVSEKHVGTVGMGFDGQILNKQAEDPYLLTSYGREYAALRDRIGLGGAVGV